MTENDQEIEDLLRENVRLTRENNHILHKLWRAEVTGFWTKVVFYALIIGVPVFIYQFYLQGYVQQLQKTYDSMRGTVEQVKQLPPLESLPAAVISRFLGK
jgi:hypothetical protein